jgi:hypothetical protein
VLSIVPNYTLKLDPMPKHTPSISEVVPGQYDILLVHFNKTSPDDYPSFISPNDAVIKSTADRIISRSGCGNEKICHLKAIFGFVQQNFNYVSDPRAFEYIKTPREALQAEAGDCDDASVLLANLLQAVGIRTRFVFIPQHVYVQAHMPDALRRYRKGEWINLDPTCSHCEIGEIPIENSRLPKSYVE